MMISAGGAASSKQQELDGVRAQIAAIPIVPVIDTSKEDALAAEENARIGALSALGGGSPWDRVLRQVSLVLPEDVWLTSLGVSGVGGRGSGSRRDAGGRGRVGFHAHRRHVLAEWGCTIPLQARGDPRSRQRASAVEPESAGERARARPVHDPRRRPFAWLCSGAGRPVRCPGAALVKRKLNSRTLGAIVGAAILAYAAAGYFMVVSPKKAESARLDEQIAVASLELRDALAAAAAQDATHSQLRSPTSSGSRLPCRARPTCRDPARALADRRRDRHPLLRSRRSRRSIAAYQVVPIDVAFDGSFYALSDFLFRLRTLVKPVRRGELHAAGRLFSVASVDFSESDRGFLLAATLKLNAYVLQGSTRRARSPPRRRRPRRRPRAWSPAPSHRGNRKRGDRVMAKRVDPLKARRRPSRRRSRSEAPSSCSRCSSRGRRP